MFGSLVVVFPSKVTGGELILRDKEHGGTIDSAKDISEHSDGPCAGYIGFYSDVEHEIATVKSGHRVILTCNLYCTLRASLYSFHL